MPSDPSQRSVPDVDPKVAARRAYIARVRDPAFYGIRPGPLDTPAKVNDALAKLQEGGANIIGPACHIDHIPRNYIVSLRSEFFDLDMPGLWYEQAGGGVSPSYVVLTRLEGLTGVDWVTVERSDDRQTALYWSYRVEARVTLFDGTPRTEKDDVPYDLRDGSDECKQLGGKSQDEKKKAETISKARAKGAQRAATFAKERLIRPLLALKQKYELSEADMPFFWLAKVYVPPDDPELNRLLALKEMGLIGDMYGPTPSRRTIIDVEARPERAALPAPPVGADLVTQANQERDRQRETVGRGTGGHSDAAAPSTSSETTQESGRATRAAPPPEDDLPPWEKPAKAADAPTTPASVWAPHKLADLIEYCETGGWPNPQAMDPEMRARFLAYLAGDGKKDYDGFLQTTRR